MKASNAISSRTAPAGAQPRNADSSSSTAERFELSGPSLKLDQRIYAYRSDIADIALAGRLFAPHYARPVVKGCGLRPTFVRGGRGDSSEAISQLLPGETFAVLDVIGPWGWGYCEADHRVGYVEMIDLAEAPEASHIVVEAAAPITADEDVLSPPLSHLPMGSRVSGVRHGSMIRIEGGFIPLSHLRSLDESDRDPVAVAQRLIGAPYLRGGRSIQGIDCSGLVQLSLAMCGIAVPRDTDHQRRLGEELSEEEPAVPGDLVFSGEHAALMVDELTVIHVSEAQQKVAVEPLETLAAGGPVERRRLA